MKIGFHTETNEKRIALTGAVLLAAVALFYAAVWTPLATVINADVVYDGAVLSIVWDAVGSMVPFLFYWTAAAFLLYLSERWGRQWLFPVLAAGASVLFNFGSLAAGLILMNGSETLGMDLLGAGIPVLMDVAQIALFWLFSYLFLVRYRDGSRKQNSAVPLRKRYARAMLCCAALPSLLSLLGRLRYDLAVGAPTGKADLIGMVVHYLADVASAAVGYLVIFLIVDRLHQTKQGDQTHDPA